MSFFSFFSLQASNPSQTSDVHNQHLESSTEVTVGVSMPEEGNYEAVNEPKQEPTDTIVDKSNRKSRLDVKESSSHVQESRVQTPSGGGYLTPTDHPATAEAVEKRESAESDTKQKGGKQGCVYAIVHINSGQGNTTVCKEPTIQGESLEMKCTLRQSSEDGNSVELVNVSSFGNRKEFEMIDSKAEEEKNPNIGEGRKEDLYAVVDKTKKKRRPPQVLAMSPTSMRFISYHVRMYIFTKVISFWGSLYFEMSLVHQISCNQYLGTN